LTGIGAPREYSNADGFQLEKIQTKVYLKLRYRFFEIIKIIK